MLILAQRKTRYLQILRKKISSITRFKCSSSHLFDFDHELVDGVDHPEAEGYRVGAGRDRPHAAVHHDLEYNMMKKSAWCTEYSIEERL